MIAYLLSYPPLSVDGDGMVWLDATDPSDKDRFVGHIEDVNDAPEYQRQWEWLKQEWLDGRRFAVGCLATARAAYSLAVGS